MNTQPSLPTNRAFLVQLRAEAEGDASQWTGRVEHVVTGQTTHFACLEELLAFIARVLDTVRAPPPREQ